MTFKKGGIPWNKGKKGSVPWNKGLSAETDERVAAYVARQTGQKRTGNWFPQYHWKGEGNPWYGKSRNGKKSPRWVEERHSRDYRDFYNRVVWMSEKTYRLFKEEINPFDLPRAMNGTEGGYQLDHKISINYGWKNGLTVEELSDKSNLQMLPWKENVTKSDKVA